jgi:hypothetical protein
LPQVYPFGMIVVTSLSFAHFAVCSSATSPSSCFPSYPGSFIVRNKKEQIRIFKVVHSVQSRLMHSVIKPINNLIIK